MNLKALYLPGIPVHRRIIAIKNLLALALIFSLAFTWKLWAGERLFPRAAMLEDFPALNLAVEYSLYAVMIISAVLMLLSRKPTVFILIFVSVMLFLVCADANRLQPWVIQYGLMLFLLLFYNWRVDEPRDYTPVFNSLRICIALIYLWDGIYKINGEWFNGTWPWMMSVFENAFSHKAVVFLSKGAYVIPFAEILAAIAVFLPTLKRIGLPVLVLIHILNIVCLGPFGKAYNMSLLPWNIFMMLFLYISFAGKTDSRFHNFSFTIQYKAFLPAFIIAAFLPLVNLFIAAPLAGTDFNPNPAPRTNIELSSEAKSKLPLYIASFAKDTNGNFSLPVEEWCMHELKTSFTPTLTVCRAIELELKRITCCPRDVNLRLKEKSAPIASL